MSKGLGHLQRRILDLLERHPTGAANVFQLAIYAYNIKPGPDGVGLVTLAQLSAIRRALAGLYKLRKVSRYGYHKGHRRLWGLGEGTSSQSDRALAREIGCSHSSV